MSKKREIQTHFDRLTVTVELRGSSGIYGDYRLTEGKAYTVLATFIHRWSDASQEPAFLIEADEGHIKAVACRRCTVVKQAVTWEDILNQDQNSQLVVDWGLTEVCAKLEKSGKNFPIYYTGNGETVQEAIAALNRELQEKVDRSERFFGLSAAIHKPPTLTVAGIGDPVHALRLTFGGRTYRITEEELTDE